MAALDVIKELKTKLRERIPSLEEVKALFPDMIYTESLTKHRNLIKYVLAGFDKRVPSGVTADVDAMTIEHLVSQSLIGTGDFSDKVVGQLGNLVMVSSEMNSKLSNKLFADKKRILLEAGYKLPPKIAAAEDWTANDIKARTLDMAIEAYEKVWKI